MTWRFEHSAESAADPHAVWKRYEDVERWSEWSRGGVVWSTIDGAFEVGTKGKSKPPGLPAGKFELVAVEPDALFASETKLPGARLRFEHAIEPRGSGSRITHRTLLDGPLAFLYVRPIRKAVERSLPDGVDRLAAMAAADVGGGVS
ncbi:MAG TPA: SRPBCC family protein [Thermoleophilaceae bacterium]|nr:SRPBCC family protein [Thermoleophilaceae bacterium]